MSLPDTAHASGIPVYCGASRIVAIGELKPNPANPWKHPRGQLDTFAAVLQANGWRRPITVSSRSGLIVRGHGARLAALKLGLSEVPIEFQAYGSEAEELADLAADNHLADLATVDKAKLRVLLETVRAASVPFSTAYGDDELAALLETIAPEPQYPIVARLNERHDYVVIVCDSETDFAFLKNLVGVRVEGSYKNAHVGEGRVVPFGRALQSLRENLDSIAQTGGPHHHAPAVP